MSVKHGLLLLGGLKAAIREIVPLKSIFFIVQFFTLFCVIILTCLFPFRVNYAWSPQKGPKVLHTLNVHA
jgi:hypothetical protein